MRRVLFLTILLVACSTAPETAWTTYTYQYERGNEDRGIQIRLNVPLMDTTDTRALAVNKMIYQNVNRFMDDQYTFMDNFIDQIQFFINDFDTVTKDIPTGNVYYQFEATGKVLYDTADLITLELDIIRYTGGSHPMRFRELVNIDPTDGSEIKLIDRVRSDAEFIIAVQQKLRNVIGLRPNQPWSDSLAVKTFRLPKEIGMTENGLLMIYGLYEIRSFSEGFTELRFPMNETRKYIRF